jgi:RNA polymerase sigma-70 factor, ECF subfamily
MLAPGTVYNPCRRLVAGLTGSLVPAPVPSDVTRLLIAWRDGDRTALDHLVPVVYDELHRLAHRQMRGERAGHTLQTTALVNEAYLRLVNGSDRVRWQNRVHFFAISAQLMRRILVDDARARGSLKRGGNAMHLSLEEAPDVTRKPNADLVALDAALTALAAVDARKSQVVELRYFGGLTVDEAAEALHVSPETVLRDWNMAKLWLLREMKSGG